MNLLAPGALFLGLLLPVIVALYLLKLRRSEREVSSVYLWRRMVRDLEANAPWQRLRPNLLLLLQLLFLAALILALARPFTWSEELSGEAMIVILDSSASMSATDAAPNRLEAAKGRARQLVGELPDSAWVTVIEAGMSAAVRTAATRDRRLAIQAIDSIQPGTGGSDLAVALELASAIAARQPGAEIVVLSDGRVELPERLALRGRLRYLPVGTSGENQAISLLNLEVRPDGSLAAFAQVRNYGLTPVQRRLLLYADGQLAAAFDLDLPATAEKSVIAADLPAGTQQVTVQLDGEDILALDDQALAVVPQARPARVTLVSEGNLFLETALRLMPGVELLSLSPQDAALDTLADLTIFDAVTPPAGLFSPNAAQSETQSGPPKGSLLFIGPTQSTDFFTVSGLARQPVLRAVDAGDPLLENVPLGGIRVLDAAQIPLPDWALPVVVGDLASETIPILLRGEAAGRRIAVLAFDLHRSDLPLQPAFPLLWVNLIRWLVPGLQGEIPSQVAPGATLSFQLPAGVSQALVRRPDGSTLEVQAENGQAIFGDTSQLGLYDIQFGQEQDGGIRHASFAVNLFSPQESDLKPAGTLGGVQVQESGAGADSGRGRREYWHPLTLLALGLLMGEWLVYQRAALARARDWLRVHLRLL